MPYDIFMYYALFLSLSHSISSKEREGRSRFRMDQYSVSLSATRRSLGRLRILAENSHTIQSTRFSAASHCPFVFFSLPSQFVCTNIPTARPIPSYCLLNSYILYMFKV